MRTYNGWERTATLQVARKQMALFINYALAPFGNKLLANEQGRREDNHIWLNGHRDMQMGAFNTRTCNFLLGKHPWEFDPLVICYLWHPLSNK